MIQVLSAGTDWIEDHVPPGVILCSARGARDAPVAEWVLAALLGASSTLLECARERGWRSRHLTDLERWTVLVVGHGLDWPPRGEAPARLRGQVLGVASHAREGCTACEDLPELLPRADAVVLLTPLTTATRGLIDARMLARCATALCSSTPRAVPVVDTDALLAETQSGRLSAVLDVTDPEPLPEEHPLWCAPGVIGHQPAHGRGLAGRARPGRRAGRRAAGPLVRRPGTRSTSFVLEFPSVSDSLCAETIRITGHDGDEIEAYLARPDGDEARGGVVVIHHMPGYDRGTKEIVRRFAELGYDAICPNLYWREAPGAAPDDAAATARAQGGVPDERWSATSAGAPSTCARCRPAMARSGVIGYCSGGRQSVLAACNLDLDAAVDCYGAFVTGTPPEGFPLKVTNLVDQLPKPARPAARTCSATRTRYPSPEQVDELDEILTARGQAARVPSLRRRRPCLLLR